MVNDLLSVLLSYNVQFAQTQDILELCQVIKQGIDLNLDENEFEGMPRIDQEIMKSQTSARILSNLSVYFTKYLNDHQTSQAYA